MNAQYHLKGLEQETGTKWIRKPGQMGIEDAEIGLRRAKKRLRFQKGVRAVSLLLTLGLLTLAIGGGIFISSPLWFWLFAVVPFGGLYLTMEFGWVEDSEDAVTKWQRNYTAALDEAVHGSQAA